MQRFSIELHFVCSETHTTLRMCCKKRFGLRGQAVTCTTRLAASERGCWPSSDGGLLTTGGDAAIAKRHWVTMPRSLQRRQIETRLKMNSPVPCSGRWNDSLPNFEKPYCSSLSVSLPIKRRLTCKASHSAQCSHESVDPESDCESFSWSQTQRRKWFVSKQAGQDGKAKVLHSNRESLQ